MKKTIHFSGLFIVLLGVLVACTGATPVPTASPAPAVVEKSTQPSPSKATPAPARATPAPTRAATRAPEKPRTRTIEELAALPLGPQRQQILEEGAKQEGEVMLYTITTGMDPIAEAFMKKYPFLKAEIFTSRAPALVEKVTAESRAGRLGGDVVNGPLAVYMPFENILMKFNSPNAQFDSAPKAATNSALLVVFTYSTKRVPPADVPARVEDLLAPKWKGKMGFFAPPNIYPGLWVGMLMETMGETNARSLLARFSGQDLFYYDSPQIAEKALTDGQVDINMQGSTTARRGVARGLAANWAAPEPTMGQINFVGLFKDTKHPHAAMLFIDYMFSDEGQSQIAALGYFTVKELASSQIDRVKLPKTIWHQTPERVAKIPEWTKVFEQLVMKK